MAESTADALSVVPSEIVYLNATRFADLRRVQGIAVPGRAVRVSGPQLAIAALGAAIVAGIHTKRLELGLVQSPGFLGLARREVFELSGGSGAPWPNHTLEALVVDVVGPRGMGSMSLGTAARTIVARAIDEAGGVISRVHMGAVARGLVERDAAGRDVPSARAEVEASRRDADRVASMCADFRDDHPDAALALKQALGRILASHRDQVRASAGGRRGDPSTIDLSSWQRLNRKPPSATDTD